MEDILYDYHIAKAMGDQLPYSEGYKRLLYIDYVFQKHGTTQAQFDSSMVWYTRHTEILSEIYKQVAARLHDDEDAVKRRIAIRDNRALPSAEGDSVDVWTAARVFRISGFPLNNRMEFNIPADENFAAGDTLAWNLHYRFLGVVPDSLRSPIMAMQIRYANDSVAADIRRVATDGWQEMRLASDTIALGEIRGFVFYAANANDTLPTLLLDSISLMRYHLHETLPTDTLSQ
jgi:hypothetical protein